jgi:hypothetical protein
VSDLSSGRPIGAPLPTMDVSALAVTDDGRTLVIAGDGVAAVDLTRLPKSRTWPR